MLEVHHTTHLLVNLDHLRRTYGSNRKDSAQEALKKSISLKNIFCEYFHLFKM